METNAQHFKKKNLPLGKICGTSDKTTKTTWRKKNDEKTKKKPRVSGKGFGGHFSQFFFLVFSSFFVFLLFLNSLSDLVFFCFLIFQTISQKRFFEVDSMWIVHSRFCTDCPFSTKLRARCPTACLSYSSFLPKSRQLFYACECLQWICG